MKPAPITWVYVAIGANLGGRAAENRQNARAPSDGPRNNVLAAIERLRDFSDHPLKVSSLWKTDPVDCPPGAPRFINAAVAFVPRPGESPESLLVKLQALEREFGRRPKVVLNEPRPLDLDIIAFGLETRMSPALVLPHPRAHLRRFVLGPLSDVDPHLILPGQNHSVSELLNRVK